MTKIAEHYGHQIEVAQYTELDGSPANYSIECLDCYAVLFDEEVKQ